MNEYRIIVKERLPATKDTLPLMVGNWPTNGGKGRVVSPKGKVVNFTTGDKAGDYGPGGWSGEYCREAGVHKVTIDDASADIETDGKTFIRLTYERTTTEELVKLVSKPMGRGAAELMLQRLEAVAPGTFQIEAMV